MTPSVPGSRRLGVAALLAASFALACGADAGSAPGTGGSSPTTSGGSPATGGSAAGGSGTAGSGTAGSDMVGGGGATGGSVAGTSPTGGSGGMTSSGGSAGSGNGGNSGAAGSGALDPSWCKVGAVPNDLRQDWDVDPYYQKYADAHGIPILTSNAPPEHAIVLACQLVIEMVSQRDDVRKALIDNHVHFTVIGENEKTNDVPEYSDLPDSINERARGLGGVPGMCAEESILCGDDPWRGESICVHEFAHTISIYGMYDADPTFEDRLEKAYQAAKAAGHFESTYAMENEQEYWGEIVQDWYYTNLESDPPNGVHNSIDTREELLAADPGGYALVKELLSEDVSWDDCYRDD